MGALCDHRIVKEPKCREGDSSRDAAAFVAFATSRFRVGPAGVEPTSCGLKVRRAASYTTTLKQAAALTFEPIGKHLTFLLCSFLGRDLLRDASNARLTT